MTRATEEVAQLRQAGRTSSARNTGEAPYLVLDSALRNAGLPQPDTLEPRGSDGARVEFESVAFEPLLSVLAKLRRDHGLHVTRARFITTDPGMVRARLSVERAGE